MGSATPPRRVERSEELRMLAAQVAALLPANPADAGAVLDYARDTYLANYEAMRAGRIVKGRPLRVVG